MVKESSGGSMSAGQRTTASAPVTTTPARRVGVAKLWHLDDEYFASVGTDEFEYEIGPYETLGQMVDGIVKWATDRGLIMSWIGHEFDLVLPGISTPAGSPSPQRL